jgi:hypothetical protein
LFGQVLSAEKQRDLHRPFDILLRIYVTENRFDYARMVKNSRDMERLSDYIDNLELHDPAEWSKDDALAYWINLYNAATIELVLKNYPVKSIKDIGGLFGSPWKKKLVKVNGKELTLDEIENDIIRPRFNDARIHFALNCAAIGCPPLNNHAFLSETLNEQLDNAVKNVLSNEIFLKITDQNISLSKIFDWYEKDFVSGAGSIREFIAKYREKDREAILDPNRKLEYLEYDWKLNEVKF